MHDIEPFHNWRNLYISSDDNKCPFYGRNYSEFSFSKKIYNYFIHPQWDDFGSNTLYTKLLYVDYELGYALIDLIGEWNDCLYNDVMYLKRDFADMLIQNGINTFVLFCDNVLNFHSSDDCYYEEWYDDIKDEAGKIILINTLDHVMDELEKIRLQQYVHFGEHLNDINWRKKDPRLIKDELLNIISNQEQQLFF